jgi:dolichol kinase
MQRKELKRQLFHATLASTIVAAIHFNIITPFMVFIILVVGVLFSYIQLKYPLPIITWFIKEFERKGEHPGKGAICLFIGALLALYLFPRDIALASIMILALGDSISHYYGRFYGKRKHPLNKSKLLEGSIVGTIAAFAGAALFIPFLQAFIAAFVAMITEAMEIEFNNRIIDDNISIPLVAGVTILLLRKFIFV